MAIRIKISSFLPVVCLVSLVVLLPKITIYSSPLYYHDRGDDDDQRQIVDPELHQCRHQGQHQEHFGQRERDECAKRCEEYIGEKKRREGREQGKRYLGRFDMYMDQYIF